MVEMIDNAKLPKESKSWGDIQAKRKEIKMALIFKVVILKMR